MKKKVISMLLVVCILFVGLGANVKMSYANENELVFNYAILAISSDEDALSIRTNAGSLNGNLCSASRITTKNMNINGNILEEVRTEVPSLFDALIETYFTNADEIENVDEVGNNINSAIKIKNVATFKNGLNINGPIQTTGDLFIEGSTLNSNNAIMISESGNISIKCNNVSISGMIYLPYGTLNIEADNINLNNVCIIANKVNLDAKYNLNINTSQKLIDFVNANAKYDVNRNYIYANGIVNENKLDIVWHTNLSANEFNIYESQNDIDYNKIATVKDTNEYSSEIADNFCEKYYYVEADGYKSLRFKLINDNERVYVEELDSDNDLIPDAIELIFGTNTYNKDSDEDGLTDYEEVIIVGTNPLNKDTDKNGINDYYDDIDKDGLNNCEEVRINTNPLYEDTDMDGLTDYEEVTIYRTNPLAKDTDTDKASDSWEVNNGTNPLLFDKGFSASASTGEVSENDPVGASVYIESASIDPESLCIERIMPHDNYFISPSIAGYLGDGFDFTVDGTFSEAKLVYTFDKSLGVLSDTFQPRIYYFNEETEMFEELENQIVEEGRVTAITTHFSTYVLLNKIEFDEVWNNEIKAAVKENNLNVAFVLDISGSMRGDKLTNAKTVINTFIDALGGR